MIEATIANGAFVHRLYADGRGLAELVAAFQYSTDAEMFARSKLAEDAARDWLDCFYSVTSSRTGEMRLIRHEAKP